jgi:hypothetical protein
MTAGKLFKKTIERKLEGSLRAGINFIRKLLHREKVQKQTDQPINKLAPHQLIPQARQWKAGDGIRTHDINLGKVALYH